MQACMRFNLYKFYDFLWYLHNQISRLLFGLFVDYVHILCNSCILCFSWQLTICSPFFIVELYWCLSGLWHCLILLGVLEVSWFYAIIIFVDNNANNNNNNNNFQPIFSRIFAPLYNRPLGGSVNGAATNQIRDGQVIFESFGDVDSAFRPNTVVLKVELNHRTVYLQRKKTSSQLSLDATPSKCIPPPL